jgi:hypothetical protein
MALPTRKDRQLLAYLAMQEGRPQSREKLASLLWADRAEEQARDSPESPAQRATAYGSHSPRCAGLSGLSAWTRSQAIAARRVWIGPSSPLTLQSSGRDVSGQPPLLSWPVFIVGLSWKDLTHQLRSSNGGSRRNANDWRLWQNSLSAPRRSLFCRRSTAKQPFNLADGCWRKIRRWSRSTAPRCVLVAHEVTGLPRLRPIQHAGKPCAMSWGSNQIMRPKSYIVRS